jgi:hypothetical protein
MTSCANDMGSSNRPGRAVAPSGSASCDLGLAMPKAEPKPISVQCITRQREGTYPGPELTYRSTPQAQGGGERNGTGGCDQSFTACRLAGQNGNPYGIKNEESQDYPDIFVCGGPRMPWAEFWKGYHNLD